MPGRRSNMKNLGVWANGEYVGSWTVRSNGADEFAYSPQWQTSPHGRPLSLSLPIVEGDRQLTGAAVANYFTNLLPDSPVIRKRLATRFKTHSDSSFDLLNAIGRDCIGAIQLLPEGEEPIGLREVLARPLSEADVAQELRGVTASGHFSGFDNPQLELRISLAGAQEKTALLWHSGQWAAPQGATPSSHIFKLPIGLIGGHSLNFHHSVENEWLCAQILKAYDLPVAACDIETFEDQKALVVKRFDRRFSSREGFWLRLPQEDFCQVFGIAPHLKYEADGGPGIEMIARTLFQSAQAERDVRTFLKAQVLFWLMAATDGHAKNFSIHLLAGHDNIFELTPLYDVLSLWPVIGNRANQASWHRAKLSMAMIGKNRHYRLKDIRRQHLITTIQRAGRYTLDQAEALITEVIEQTPAALAAVGGALPNLFPDQVATPIFEGMMGQARRLAES